MRLRIIVGAVCLGATALLTAPAAHAGRPKDCTMLPRGQQTRCKQEVARKCGHLSKYWPKVHCEDRVVKSMDTCRKPSTVQTCKSLYMETEVCAKAASMMGSSGVSQAWLSAVRRFPAVLAKVRRFRASFKACGGKIPGCRLAAYSLRQCTRAASTFRAKWARYYRTFKSRNLKSSWRHLKTSQAVAGVLATLRPVAAINQNQLIRVNDDAVAKAIRVLEARHKKLKKKERRAEARMWRRVRGYRYKKLHKKGRWANCVFSDQPLQRREKRADAIKRELKAGDSIYVRCYFRRKPRRMKLSRIRMTIYTPQGSRAIPLNLKRYPKAHVLELTGQGQLGHALRALRPGEHEVSIRVHGSTGRVTGRTRVRNYDAHGKRYDTTRTRTAGVTYAKGFFTYVVPKGGGQPAYGGAGRKGSLRGKLRHKRRRRR